jgi:hypothetical protein
MTAAQVAGGKLRVCVPILATSLCLLPATAVADDVVIGGMTWMTQFPATWNAGAPKIVSDGLHSYAALCGYDGSEHTCSVARRRGGEPWARGTVSFFSQQPAVTVLDRKGRLNVFYNNPQLHHMRFDHPAIDLRTSVEIPIPYSAQVAYLHASYDAPSDTIMLAFNETTSWTTFFSIKSGDAGGWMAPAPLPGPDPGAMYLYARTLRARGRYFILAGQHPRVSSNPTYTAAVLWESLSPAGPWTVHMLHQSTGNNIGVFYQNMTIAVDLQADAAGNVRALLQISEDGSGHPGVAEGLHIAREEDGYALRHVGSGIDDAWALHVDPSGVHFAIALILSDPIYPEAGHMVAFRSDDGGATWGAPRQIVPNDGINPVAIESRSGSMLGGKDVDFIYSNSAFLGPPFDRVLSAVFPLTSTNTANRYDYAYTEADGTTDYIRAYRESTSGRSYYYSYDYETNGSFTISYSYTAGDYYQVYIAGSDGSYRYYNSDGYQSSYTAPQVVSYWYDDPDGDGTRDFVYLVRDPATELLWWVIYDYDTRGDWKLMYVYYRGTYWYIEFRGSDGHFTRYDSTGFLETA